MVCPSSRFLHLCKDETSGHDAIVTVLRRHPRVAKVRDAFGRSPLFYAVKVNQPIVTILEILDAFPAAAYSQDLCGDTVIRMLFDESKDVALVQAILRRHPYLATYKNFGVCRKSALFSLSDIWKTKSTTSMHDQHWQKLLSTLEAAHVTCFGGKDPSNPLKAALKLALPNDIIRLVVQCFPELASEPMCDKGTLPLQYYLSHPRFSQNGSRTLCAILSANEAVSNELLKGQFLLHVALRNGFMVSDGLRYLGDLCPNALYSRCPRSDLMPWMLSQDTATAFWLLCEHPVLSQ